MSSRDAGTPDPPTAAPTHTEQAPIGAQPVADAAEDSHLVDYGQILARYTSTFSYERLPATVQTQARAVVLDTLGAMLAASSSRYGVATLLGRFVDDSGGKPQATLIGQGVPARRWSTRPCSTGRSATTATWRATIPAP